MIYYYCDVSHKRIHLVAPLSNLVGETLQTKATNTKAAETKKRVWYWTGEHQDVFDATKQALVRKLLLTYPQSGNWLRSTTTQHRISWVQ